MRLSFVNINLRDTKLGCYWKEELAHFSIALKTTNISMTLMTSSGLLLNLSTLGHIQSPEKLSIGISNQEILLSSINAFSSNQAILALAAKQSIDLMVLLGRPLTAHLDSRNSINKAIIEESHQLTLTKMMYIALQLQASK